MHYLGIGNNAHKYILYYTSVNIATAIHRAVKIYDIRCKDIRTHTQILYMCIQMCIHITYIYIGRQICVNIEMFSRIQLLTPACAKNIYTMHLCKKCITVFQYTSPCLGKSSLYTYVCTCML